MEKRRDLCFACTQSQKSLNVCVWDVQNGVALRTFSCDGGHSGSQLSSNAAALCLLKEGHLLCAPKNLPYIYVWNLTKEHTILKIACAGLVRSLSCSPDGVYCAGAIGEKLYIWHVCTGNLLAVVCQHYQAVNVVKFTDDGVHFISGGDDSRVIVWRLSNVLSEAYASSEQTLLQAPPTGPTSSLTRHIWSDHSLPVTDLHSGRGGLNSKVVTVSLDQTCKVYEVTSGVLLCSILLDFGLTAVTMDQADGLIFVGAANGSIYQVDLPYRLLRKEEDADNFTCYKGHSKAISGLALATWSNHLVSTSNLEDKARVWDITSGQTLREVKHRGPVLKMLVSGGLMPSFSGGSKGGAKRSSACPTAPSNHSLAMVVKPFKKQLHYARLTPEDGNGAKSAVSIPIQLRGIDPLCDLAELQYMEPAHSVPSTVITSDVTEKDLLLQTARKQIEELKDVHRRTYTFVMDKIMQSDIIHTQ